MSVRIALSVVLASALLLALLLPSIGEGGWPPLVIAAGTPSPTRTPTNTRTPNVGDGDEYIYGGSGEDTIKGGFGTDYLYGGSGTDTCDGGLNNPGVLVDVAFDCEVVSNVP